MRTTKQTSEVDAIRDLQRLVEQARAGDESVLPQLQRALDQHPEIWRHFGNLASHVQDEWVKMLAGSDLAMRESLLMKAQSMHAELEGPSPSRLEQLLCDAVVTTWLEAEYFAVLLVSSHDKGTPRQIESLHLRRDAAHKRHLTAIKTLAEVRKLLPTTSSRKPSGSRAIKRGSSRSKTCRVSVRTAGNAPGRQTIPLKARSKS